MKGELLHEPIPDSPREGSQIGDHRLSISCGIVEQPDQHCGDGLVLVSLWSLLTWWCFCLSLCTLNCSLVVESVMSLCSPDDDEMADDYYASEEDDTDCKPERRTTVDDKHLWFPEYQHDIYQFLRDIEV